MAADSPSTAKVVVIAVPDLRWIDLPTMPALRAFARGAAEAELSVKTAAGTPRCADGSLTFSAGNRANADETVLGCDIAPHRLALLRAAALDSKFAAHVGALGQALHGAGLTTAAVGAAAIPLLADAAGHVDVTNASFVDAMHRADVVATVDDPLFYVPGVDRVVATRFADDLLRQQLAEVPPDATVLVAGTSDGIATTMHLHVLLIHGAGWRHEALRSPSTRAPYVQLRDLAPTILAALHIETPSTMVGRPAYLSGTPAGTWQSYADDDDHAVTARDVGKRLRNLLAELGIAVVALFVLGAWWRSALVAASWLARFAVGVPVASFLAQVLPWWHWGTWAYAGIVVGIALAIGVGVTLLARRGRLVDALLFAPVVTAAVLIVDQLAGAPLQLSAPLGDSPIVAGRFHGMGNTDFAFMCTAIILIAAVVAGRLRPRGRAVAVTTAAVLLLVAMAVDAAPPLGDDFGGLLAMAPVAALLLTLLAGIRLTWRRVLLIVVGAAFLATAVALVDYARPAAHQTHVGRFVGQVLHGGAGRVLRRKLDASLGSFGNVAITGFVIVTAVAAVVDRRELLRLLRRVPGLAEASFAIVVLAVLGTFLNDSGVVVASSALLLAVLALTAPGPPARMPRAAAAGDDVPVLEPRRSGP